jgi:hypothetical protein
MSVDHDVEVTVDDLDEVLRAAEVDPSAYHLYGSSDEGLCILPEGQAWKVFMSERGSRSDDRTFNTEDEACVYFLKRIFQLWHR